MNHTMWCPHCQAETETKQPDAAQQLLCANCERPFVRGPSTDKVQEARNILARWSSSDLLDQISTLPEIPPLSSHYDARTAKSDDIESSESAETPTSSHPPAIASDDKDASGSIETPASADVAATEAVPEFEAAKKNVAADKTEQPIEASGPADATSDALEPSGDQQSQSTRASMPAFGDAEPSPVSNTSEAETAANGDSELSGEGPTEDPSLSEGRKEGASGKSEARLTMIDGDQTEIAKDDADEIRQTTHPDIRPPRMLRRPEQTRSSQKRSTRPRKPQPQQTLKESKPVSKKFRVDRPGGSPADNEAASVPEDSTVRGNSSPTGARYRIDDPESVEETLGTTSGRSRTQSKGRQRYIDEGHPTALRGPHFQIQVPKRSNLTSLTGQFLAYVGVLGLTIGTAMVIYGHFGGYSEYTPTGWLVTTVAQMLLFLGVINLVSGGIEQTNDDVSTRINYLGEQLMRIEQVTEEALRGPKISAHRYANPDAEVAPSERQLVPFPDKE